MCQMKSDFVSVLKPVFSRTNTAESVCLLSPAVIDCV